MERIEKIKTHFDEEAKEFDEIILKLIPFYEEMVEALILSIPHGKDESIKIIDLGCGTGTISKKVQESFPNAKITCLDMAENMIKMAKIKLGESEKNDYLTEDFYKFEFDKTYDVVLSSLALHHLENDEDKEMFYRKIHGALTDSGVFYNADVVLGSNDYLQDTYLEKWKKYMSRSVSRDEINHKWLVKYKEEDRPTSLMNHLKMLENVGFKDIDVVWKYYTFAVYGGFK